MPEFVSLAVWMVPQKCAEPMPESAPEEIACDPDPEPSQTLSDALADVRRFRAAFADALEMSVRGVVREIAVDIVARELRLAPSDISAIVARAIERYGIVEPFTVRTSPDDARAIAGRYADVVADVNLRGGDVIIELLSGSIDATLGARLEHLLTDAPR